MDCIKVQELLSQYVDNMLDDNLNKEIEMHISACSECREEYELLMNIIDGCKKFDEEDLPQGFDKELHERLVLESSKAPNQRYTLFFRKYGTAAAALLVLAVSIGFIFNSGILNSSRNSTGTPVKQELSSLAGKAEGAQSPAPQMAGAAPKVAVGQQYDAGSKALTAEDSAGRANYSMNSGMVSTLVTVNITSDEYAKKYQDIVVSIEGLEGYLKEKTPEIYMIPVKNTDTLIKKLKEDYNIVDISVSTADLSSEYNNLQTEIANLENSEKDQTSGGNNSDTLKLLEDKNAEFKALEDKVNYTYIQINRK